MTTHVVVLGAGFGGLELTTRLAGELADEVRVTLIDKSDAFVFGFAKLDVLFGRRAPEEVRSHYARLERPGVTFVQATITGIDPHAKRVVTDAGTFDADVLVVALGADTDPALTPGFVESGGHEFYSVAGATRMRSLVDSIDGGRVVVAVLGGAFKCPPAPWEACFMLHDHLVRRGVRDGVTIDLHTPLPLPVPVSRPTSEAVLALMAERDLRYHLGSLVTSIDPSAKVATTAGGEQVPFDVFVGIPVHKAPPVVVSGGLAEDDGWIAVDHATFETKFPDVFAVGDITSAPVPRAGVIAEGEAGTVADVLRHRIGGGPAPAPYAGLARCYMEMGDGTVGTVDVDFLGPSGPTALFDPPSLGHAAEKVEFGASRVRRWFG